MPKIPVSVKERRAKRQARREKQRLTNILRAKKMHQARVEDTDRLPAQPATGNARGVHYHVGCSGWFYWHWRGLFYSQDLPTSGWFGHYKTRFKTVELNASFYGWPTVATVKSWRRQAQRSDFIYTVKVNEIITHIKRFIGTKQLITDFYYIAHLLGKQMGCFLFQLPPSYHYTPARLKAIVRQLDPQHRNVVEFRHASWWREEVYAAFRHHSIIFCSCSAPRLPDALIKTADDIYIRFHGTARWYQHDYSKAELAEWTARVHTSGATGVWAYFNNDRNGFAITNATAFSSQLKASVKNPAVIQPKRPGSV